MLVLFSKSHTLWNFRTRLLFSSLESIHSLNLEPEEFVILAITIKTQHIMQ